MHESAFYVCEKLLPYPEKEKKGRKHYENEKSNGCISCTRNDSKLNRLRR